MRTPAVLLLALVAATALPSGASAKEVSRVEVCGASGCMKLPDDVAHSDAFMQGGVAADPPARGVPWWAIRYTISPAPGEDIEPFSFRNAYVPSAGLARERAEGGGFWWFEPSPAMVKALAPYLERVESYPASTLRGLAAGTPEPPAAATTPVPAGNPGLPADAPAPAGDDSPRWALLAAAAAALLALALAVARRRGIGTPLRRPAPRAGLPARSRR